MMRTANTLKLPIPPTPTQSVLWGSVLLGLGILATPASAVLPLRSYTVPLNTTPPGFNTKLFELEGRIGGTRTFEYTFKTDTNFTTAGMINQNWTDGVAVNWQLDWNRTTNTATFQLTNPINGTTISSTFNGAPPDTFNGFSLFAKSIQDQATLNRVAPGTLSEVNVTQVIVLRRGGGMRTENTFSITPDTTSPGPTSLLTSATAPVSNGNISNGNGNFTQNFFALTGTRNREILQMRGTGRIDWPSGNPVANNGQSLVTFGIIGYNQTATAVTALNIGPKTPEPSSLLGLLAIGGLGAIARLKGVRG